MTEEQKHLWLRTRAAWAHHYSSPRLAAAALLGCVFGWCIEAGHEPKGILERCKTILVLRGVKF